MQKTCRKLKHECWKSKATKLQELADMNDTRGFHPGLKAVCGKIINC